MKYFATLILVLFFSCKTEKEKGRESIEHTSKVYVTEKLKKIDSTYTIDTLRIYRIDTVSTKADLFFKLLLLSDSLALLKLIADNLGDIAKAKMDQYKTLAYMNTLTTSSSDLTIFKDDVLENNKKASIGYENTIRLANQIDSLSTVYASNKLDSTDFLYYKSFVKLCYSEKKLSQRCDPFGLKISKDFRVIK